MREDLGVAMVPRVVQVTIRPPSVDDATAMGDMLMSPLGRRRTEASCPMNTSTGSGRRMGVDVAASIEGGGEGLLVAAVDRVPVVGFAAFGPCEDQPVDTEKGPVGGPRSTSFPKCGARALVGNC